MYTNLNTKKSRLNRDFFVYSYFLNRENESMLGGAHPPPTEA